MKRRMAAIAVLLILFSFAGYAVASCASRLEGKPAVFTPGSSNGYFVWQDKKGLHLRTTTPGDKHVFSGTVCTDGEFALVENLGGSESADDRFQINEAHDKITFRFTNTGDTSSIDLHVHGGTYVTFSLSMDANEIDPANIYIGKNGWHPANHKFTLRYDKGSKKYSHEQTVIIVDEPYWWEYPPFWDPESGCRHDRLRHRR